MTRLAQAAFNAGVVVWPHHLTWERQGDCLSPVQMEVWSRAVDYREPWKHRRYLIREDGAGVRLWPEKARAMPAGNDRGDYFSATLVVRCRHCANCLRQRSRMWTARAIDEMRRSQRTWFGTVTLSPDTVGRLLHRAAGRVGSEWETRSYTERMDELLREVSEELTKYLKRVRKVSGAKLRYLLAFEDHKSGVPHAHLLIHEVFGSPPVLWKHLDLGWSLGFTKWNLIKSGENEKAAVYACKYLTKANRARVRASIGYGRSRPITNSNECEIPF